MMSKLRVTPAGVKWELHEPRALTAGFIEELLFASGKVKPPGKTN